MTRLMMVFVLCFVLVFPVQGQSLSFNVNPFKKNSSVFSRFPELSGRISSSVLTMAIEGYRLLKEQGKVSRDGVLTVIDFNRPSVDERLFVIDVNRGQLLYSALVAHGSGSGENYADSFSNVPGSRQSSLGFYTTGETYDGKNGYSLKLQGMERGINDNAESRSIVIHGANYVSYDFIKRYGRLGRSEGCPALSFDCFQQVIDLIKGGSCLFIYHDGQEYAAKSTLFVPDLARNKPVSGKFS